ncbi:MAG: RNA methyltransferase [Bdellovibrionales bacterium CG10_big_fil_rev_8_21_14_0_10_45_34]|nr:MAG: RNA methyltransferase [Bdellovibrionales bacterium CG10_big_fil_rev_8_21_14_0_10_45_34]
MPRFLAVSSTGLLDVLEQELTDLGFRPGPKIPGAVPFEASWEGCYRANYELRSATRILYPIADFFAYDGEDLYNNIRKRHDFTKYINCEGTLAVFSTVGESKLTDQRFVSMKVKDAIVDQFYEKYDRRPNVESKQPDLPIVVHVIKNHVHVALDTSGESLYRRGYKTETVTAPIKEHLAFALLKMTGWKPGITLVDPMCGSGTFLIEAALWAAQVAPGTFRRRFAFQRWLNFQKDKYQLITQEASQRELEVPESPVYFGFDQDRSAIRAAKENAQNAGVESAIALRTQSVQLLTPPEGVEPGIVVINPPYGERLDFEIEEAYRDLGYTLKKNFAGWDVWILSGNADALKFLQMKSDKKFRVFNGPIDCRWLRYQVRQGPERPTT